MTSLILPRAFTAYQCQRSLVCCHAPVRAPIAEDDLARIERALQAGDADGPLIAATLSDRVVRHFGRPTDPWVWRQRDDACVNVDAVHRACAVHRSAGLAALPTSCRNFPRWIAHLPGPDARVEVAFALTCPTAARLLAEDPEPFALVAADLQAPAASTAWPYASDKVAPAEPLWDGLATAPLARVLALREAWWARLAAVRTDALGLLVALRALEVDPLGGAASEPELVATPAIPQGAQHALLALERTPGRGASYRAARARALEDLARAAPPAELAAMAGAAPELAAAFASAGVQWLGVHDPRPAAEVARIVARRTMVVIRLVDALCALVPHPLVTLFADAFAAASFVDA